MNDVDDVWWCRTPKNSVVYGSGERRIAVSGVSHYTKGVLRPQNKMAAFLLKFYTGWDAQPFPQTTGNLKMELSGGKKM
jgi:hypothetical protein